MRLDFKRFTELCRQDLEMTAKISPRITVLRPGTEQGSGAPRRSPARDVTSESSRHACSSKNARKAGIQIQFYKPPDATLPPTDGMTSPIYCGDILRRSSGLATVSQIPVTVRGLLRSWTSLLDSGSQVATWGERRLR